MILWLVFILASFFYILFFLAHFSFVSFADISCPISKSTQTSSTGLKTRHFNNIITELTSSLRIHAACGSRLGGVSLEFTGELNDEGFSVTECVGGSMELDEGQLGLRYQVGLFFILFEYTLMIIFIFPVFLRS